MFPEYDRTGWTYPPLGLPDLKFFAVRQLAFLFTRNFGKIAAIASMAQSSSSLAVGMWLDYKKSVSVKSGQSAAWFGSAHEESDAQKCRDRFEAPQNRHRLA